MGQFVEKIGVKGGDNGEKIWICWDYIVSLRLGF